VNTRNELEQEGVLDELDVLELTTFIIGIVGGTTTLVISLAYVDELMDKDPG
jgi:hypothetical protein